MILLWCLKAASPEVAFHYVSMFQLGVRVEREPGKLN